MELYIIRHAQSTNNALTDQRDRVKDPPLTELGEKQAKIVANHLIDGVNPEYIKGSSPEATGNYNRRGYHLDRLYCSAMGRALQTAQPIGYALGLDPEVWVDIHERGGIFLKHDDVQEAVGYPGKTRSEILAEYPNYKLPEAVSEEGWWWGGYERWPTCHGRAIKVAHQLNQWAERDERIGLVTHAAFVDALLRALFNSLPDRRIMFHHYNTAITRIDFRPDGRLGIRYLNRIDHLPAELIS